MHLLWRGKLASIHPRRFPLNKVLLHIHFSNDSAFPALLPMDDSHVRSCMPMRSSAYKPFWPHHRLYSLSRPVECRSICRNMLYINKCTAAAAVGLTLRLCPLVTRLNHNLILFLLAKEPNTLPVFKRQTTFCCVSHVKLNTMHLSKIEKKKKCFVISLRTTLNLTLLSFEIFTLGMS